MALNSSSAYILKGRYDHSLSLDATIMVSKNCPAIGEHVVTNFVTQLVTIVQDNNGLPGVVDSYLHMYRCFH